MPVPAGRTWVCQKSRANSVRRQKKDSDKETVPDLVRHVLSEGPPGPLSHPWGIVTCERSVNTKSQPSPDTEY